MQVGNIGKNLQRTWDIRPIAGSDVVKECIVSGRRRSAFAVAQVIEQLGVALQAELQHRIAFLAADGAHALV